MISKYVLCLPMASLPKAIVHPYHTYFKEIFQANATLKYRLLRCLECLAVLLSIIRLFTLQLAVTLASSQLHWDPVAQFIFTKRHLYDAYLLLSLLFLLSLTLIINLKLFLSPSTGSITWQAVGYDLIVRNVEQAKACQMPAEKLTFRRISRTGRAYQGKVRSFVHFCLCPFISLLSTIQSTLTIEGLDRRQFGSQPLTLFPFFSHQLRRRLLQFQILNDGKAWIVLALAFTPLCLALTFTAIQGTVTFPLEAYGPLPWALLLLDLTLLWTVGYLAIRCLFLINHYLIITSLAYRWHLKAGHLMLRYLIAKSHTHHSSVSSWQFLHLQNFLHEHSRLSSVIDTTNRQMVHFSVLCIILCNTPTNIYFVFRLISVQLLLLERTLILLLVITQTIAVIILLVPLAQCNGTLHRTAKYLPGIQCSVLQCRRNLALKFKYDTLQASLTEATCLKSGTTIGSICLVTFESLYKLLVYYALYLLCFFTLLSK